MQKRALFSVLGAAAMLLVLVLLTGCTVADDNPVSNYIEVNETSVKLAPGETFAIQVKNSGKLSMTFESADPTIATVDANGVVTGVADGETTIVVRSEGNSEPQEARINVWTCDPDIYDPLTLVAKADGVIDFEYYRDDYGQNLEKPILYTINDGEEQTVTIGEGFAVKAGDKVRLTSRNERLGWPFKTEERSMLQCVLIRPQMECAVYGNVMSLISPDGNWYKNRTIKHSAALSGLFMGSNIVNDEIRNLTLPATEVSDSCYWFMFRACDLKRAPELPAKKVGIKSYEQMFSGSTALEVAPDLPATTLAERCYADMFDMCYGLKVAPSVLPATDLAPYCYDGMFGGCYNMTKAPELPATKMAEGCYQEMFVGCKKVTEAPALPATKLAANCYNNMFRYCHFAKASALPATELAPHCYEGMFYGCSSLTEAPELKAASLPEGCYQEMFYDCSRLSSVTCLATEMTGPKAIYDMLLFAGEDESVTTRTFKTSAANTHWVNNDRSTGAIDQWCVPDGWTIE